MDLPTTLEDCHRIIRDLAEENAALRRSGEDFGHLAERLNLSLQQIRQSGHAPGPLKMRPGHGADTPREAGALRWPNRQDRGRRLAV